MLQLLWREAPTLPSGGSVPWTPAGGTAPGPLCSPSTIFWIRHCRESNSHRRLDAVARAASRRRSDSFVGLGLAVWITHKAQMSRNWRPNSLELFQQPLELSVPSQELASVDQAGRYTQWLKCLGAQGNGIPAPLIIGTQRSCAS